MTKRIIPEKTVELWTACSLVDVLSPDVWIWSRPDGVDQDVWAPDLRKWFVLELKAPIAPSHTPPKKWQGWTKFIIDLEQLRTYLSLFGGAKSQLPDAVYVISDPSLAPYPWNIPPGTPSHNRPTKAAHPLNRWKFPSWSYAIQATSLAWLLRNVVQAKDTATVYLKAGHLRHSRGSELVPLHSLGRFLTATLYCFQWPTSVACSSNARQQVGGPLTLLPFDTADTGAQALGTRAQRVVPDTVRIRGDLIERGILNVEAPTSELEYGEDMLSSAMEALERHGSRHRILVGVS